MSAVYKKELRTFFRTPVGYVFIGVFLAVSGFLFSYTCLRARTSDTSEYFIYLMFAYVILIPLLTMKSFAEEKRMGTEQLLLTSPLKLSALVAAKFLACFTEFLLTLAASALYFIPLSSFGEPNWGKIAGCLIGVTLIAACFIAIGLFVSALTQNQFVAALGTIFILLALLAIGLVEGYIDAGVLKTVVGWISIYSRFSNFTIGIFDVASAVYYISAASVFLFLTVRVYEKRRYA